MPPGSDWRRLHPLSPLLRAARVFVIPAVFFVDDIPAEVLGQRLVPGLLLVVALAAGAGSSWWAWRSTAYRVTAEEVELWTGMLFRRHRRVPLARLESVDVARPVAARLFGLAELRLEAVSEGGSEVRLSYVDHTTALALREQIAARRDAMAATPGEPGHEAPAPAMTIFRAGTRELLAGTVLGRLAQAWPVVLVATVVVLVIAGPGAALGFGPLAASVPLVIGLAEAERLHGFTLSEANGGLQIRRGLFNEMQQRVAVDRIQAVSVVEPLLWRPFRRARLVVDVAGYRGGEQMERQHASVLVPIAPAAVVAAVLERVQPGLRLDGLAHARPPRAARWRAPVRWRACSVAWTARHAVVRRGVFQRRTDVVPHVKVQSLRVTQGPWQHALGLATLHVDTAGREISARAPHRSRDDAERLAWESRARAAAPPGG
jgi:putative membrane protein